MTDAVEVLSALPIWHGAPRFTPLTGGVSNTSFRVDDADGSYIARLGDDYPFHQVSRDREIRATRAAYHAGLSPEIIHAEPGIMVMRYIIDAKTYGEADVRSDWKRCLDLVKTCHHKMGREVTGQGAIFWVFQILREYAATLKAHNHRALPKLQAWMKITDELEAAQIPLPIVFGHHDLLPTNFLDDGKRLWLIDWEYGAFGTAMFDLANMAANNSFTPEMEVELLRAYFEKPASEATLKSFHAMKVASALREAMWGMVSEIYLKAPGVDYIAYAEEYTSRFETIYNSYQQRFGSK